MLLSAAIVAMLLVASPGATAAPSPDEIVVTDQRAMRAPPQVVGPAPARSAPFASLEVTDTSDPASPTFVFSVARATSDDPVMISTPGRELTDADATEYRVSLQKHWLSVNVPEPYELVGRSMVECEPAGKWEFPYCDLYEYIDPDTHLRHEYFIFTGNWNYDL